MAGASNQLNPNQPQRAAWREMMGWYEFIRIFDKTIESAMRYSIHEALRRQCQSAGGGTTEGIAEDAIETFKRKMEKHDGRRILQHEPEP